MANPLIRKLEQFSRVPAEDQRLLEQAMAGHIRRFGPRDGLFCVTCCFR